MSRVCDLCKRDPESFEADDKTIGWWFVIPFGADDPVVLMSNLELQFMICPDRNPPQSVSDTFMCAKCFDKMMEAKDE